MGAGGYTSCRALQVTEDLELTLRREASTPEGPHVCFGGEGAVEEAVPVKGLFPEP